jgi:hypothetical protein
VTGSAVACMPWAWSHCNFFSIRCIDRPACQAGSEAVTPGLHYTQINGREPRNVSDFDATVSAAPGLIPGIAVGQDTAKCRIIQHGSPYDVLAVDICCCYTRPSHGNCESENTLYVSMCASTRTPSCSNRIYLMFSDVCHTSQLVQKSFHTPP